MSSIENSFNSSMILHTSRYLFDNFGFNNVGVDRLCKEANISKMTFYKYFKSKEKLIESCLVFNQEYLENEVNTVIESYPKLKPLEILEKIYFLHVDLSGFYHLMFKAIFEIEKLYPVSFNAVVDYRSWLVNVLVKFFSNITDENLVNEINLLLFIIDGSIIQLLSSGNVSDREIIWAVFCDKYYNNLEVLNF